MHTKDRRQQDRRSQDLALDHLGKLVTRPRVLHADTRLRYLRARAVIEDIAGRSLDSRADPRKAARR